MRISHRIGSHMGDLRHCDFSDGKHGRFSAQLLDVGTRITCGRLSDFGDILKSQTVDVHFEQIFEKCLACLK